ncbi:glycosyltransferase family 92 protein F13G3.3-like isoform X1 [Ascaphus truei]|uniref:glycosyltransferase family 92 protein F13G3.3-like isoform X1 n=2 Tax=Ascaphus truei TaxID=8439 RepID=UPI003F5A28FE
MNPICSLQEKEKMDLGFRLFNKVYYKKCLAAFYFTSIALISTYYHHLLKAQTILEKPKPLKTAIGSITALEDNRTFIISAYYDNRESNSVRVIAILHVQEVTELYCWFHCTHKDDYMPVRAQIDVHSDRFGFPYATTDLLCREPLNCDPKYVSIHWSTTRDRHHIPVFEIKNSEPGPLSVDFTVCISTMFGNSSNVLQFIQAIEMYRLLGARRVVIYKNSCSVAMGKVLDYYISEGMVEIIHWPIDSYLLTSDSWHHYMDDNNEIGYFGQLAALNDCMYRNMYRSKYVAFNDIDEIILPKKHKDWKGMMESLKKQYPSKEVFLIENHYFPLNIKDSTFRMSFPTNISGDNILQHIYYEPEQPNVYNNHKMIVNPRKVIQTSVHFVLKAYGEKLEVSSNIAGLQHIRKAKQPNLPFTSLIKDTTIWKYNASLITNVNNVLRILNCTN